MPVKILIVEDELLIAKNLESILIDAGYVVCKIARTVKSALDIIEQESPEIAMLDIYLKGNLTGIELAYTLNKKNIPFIYLSANSNKSVLDAAKITNPYGFMIKPFRDEEVLIALDIARIRHQSSLETQTRKENLLQQELLKAERFEGNTEEKLMCLTIALQTYIPFDFVAMGRFDNQNGLSQWCSFLRKGYNTYDVIGKSELLEISGMQPEKLESLKKNALFEVRPIIYTGDEFKRALEANPLKQLYATTFSLRSHMVLPLLIDYGMPFVLSFYSKSDDVFLPGHLHLLNNVQQSLISVIYSIFSQADDPGQGRAPALCPNKPEASFVKSTHPFPEIIGNSPPLLVVLDFVKQVAPADISVLILGETGTGKEKVASKIHELSARFQKPFVKVNCAALPQSLIESELFGHEKGSFTGAIAKKEGRFEHANGGTIFLDEIGDVPMDVQVKLLRVLQEREIDRIGGKQAIKIDVRIIAATNKDLEKEVADGRFRMDLYYRLNVFPLFLPPLRERKEDIPLLANHFIERFSSRHQKDVQGLSAGAAEELTLYDWPGNIRELENTIERSVVLSSTRIIQKVYIKPPSPILPVTTRVKTIEQVEKDHIIAVLQQCNNKIYGPGGAAELLNIPPSTLSSKIKKLSLDHD